MRLDDPRLAQALTGLVDRRVDAALAGAGSTRYGIVAAVDTATRRVSVRLGASPTPSPGFVYPAGDPPVVGDLVRVHIAGADRYVEANMAGTGGPLHYVPLYPSIEIVPNGSTTTGAIARTQVEVTGLPAGVVEAVYVQSIMKVSAVPTNDARMTCQGGASPLGQDLTAYAPWGTVNRLQAVYGIVVPDGPNKRTLSYDWLGTGTYTLTYYLRAFGYFRRGLP